MKYATGLHSRFTGLISPKTEMIASLVGSSNYRGVADDALKDEDNAGWVMKLDPPVCAQWVERIRWIRLIDRFAERELLDKRQPVNKGQPTLQNFLADWQHLVSTGTVKPESAHSSLLNAMQLCWFDQANLPSIQLSLTAWKQYVQAIAHYHTDYLIIHTIAEYEQMLTALGGSLFQVLPFLSEAHHQAAHYFGIMDQFYNHLRDLHEDAKQGICNLPSELLDEFGVSRAEILQQQAIKNPGYHRMMQFWLEEYLHKLRFNAERLLRAENLHPSWQILCDWSTYRYRRIERVFRECQFDYTQFSQVYWQQVRRDLPLMLNHICHHPAQPLPLKFSPQTIPVQPTSVQVKRLERSSSWAA